MFSNLTTSSSLFFVCDMVDTAAKAAVEEELRNFYALFTLAEKKGISSFAGGGVDADGTLADVGGHKLMGQPQRIERKLILHQPHPR